MITTHTTFAQTVFSAIFNQEITFTYFYFESYFPDLENKMAK